MTRTSHVLLAAAAALLAPRAAAQAPATKPAASRPSSEKPSMLKVGDTAPDFRVPDHTGKERTLGEFRGKKVVLYFYPKADTPGCTAESCGFRDKLADYGKKNVQILGVSVDPPADNAAFVKKYNLTFPLLCDTTRSLSLAYGAVPDAKAQYANRITYVIDENGKIEQAHAKVDAKNHPATLLESLGTKN